MKKQDVIKTIHHKIESAKKYGIQHIYIHSKGKTNIKRINNCLPEFEKKYGSIHKVEKEFPDLEILVIQIILQ